MCFKFTPKKFFFKFTTAFILIIVYMYYGSVLKDSSRLLMGQYPFRPAKGNRRLRTQNISLLEKSQYKELKFSNKTKVIVWWLQPSWMRTKHGSAVFKKCDYKNCYITNNKKEFPLHRVDVLMYHYEINSPIHSLPLLRDSKTKYLFSNYESSSRVLSHKHLLPYKDKFHWTMGYDTTNDIPDRQFYFTKCHDAPLFQNNANNKTKLAAWFVSNCKSIPSGRDRLAKSLQKYIDVDIYGKCGRLTCNKDKSSNCYKLLEENYFFYLSFENSLCRNYITEKAYKVLKRNVIPVVYGYGPYKKFLPPKSYIDVFDFTSVEELSKYLIYLSKNATAYNEYFSWKSHYCFARGSHYDRYCSICKLVTLHGDKDLPYVDLEKSLLTSACINSSNKTIKMFIDGKKLDKPFNDYLYRNIWKTSTFTEVMSN